ncbi:hypothetical protein [Candidatus Pantoea persica]|uniref:hypothetical protein n=1 Tax=Candidatus Pantoea persica TaxID=2518128 RepID=UPI00215D7376|nr:hypothetical protein [Candidatus Pantoea persica]MBA2814026.1 ABC transporter ATPase [Candidatus Pantoea persica]
MRKIAWMGQRDDLYPWLSVRDNVMLAARLGGQRPDRARADALLAQVELAGEGSARPASLSGGMRTARRAGAYSLSGSAGGADG